MPEYAMQCVSVCVPLIAGEQLLLCSWEAE